jgi:uncharacterized protein with FMN-binding domain
MKNNIKKIAPFGGFIPAIAFTVCAGISLATYSAPEFDTILAETVSEETTEKTTETTTSEKETKATQIAPSVQNISETSTYKDGTYTGTGTGYGGETKVQVIIENGKIKEITILSHHDDSPFIDNAKALLKTIVDKQSTNVDTVSGATYSSVGIINAVRDALSQAGGTETELETTSKSEKTSTQKSASVSISNIAESDSYEDGTYTGSATGYGGLTTVQVVISGGKISSIEILSHHDDSPFIDNAKALLKTIVSAQSTNVDTVSGATYSSAGIINAVRNALSKAGKVEEVPEVTTPPKTTTTVRTTKTTKTTQTTTTLPIKDGYIYADGTYEGTGEGFKGDVTVSVTVKNHKIETVKVISNSDDTAYFSKASVLCETIVKSQSVDVDTVSGATFSSLGIIDAVSDALSKSYEKALSEQGSTVATTTTSTISTANTTTKTTTTTIKKDETTEDTSSDKQLINGDFIGISVCYPDDEYDFEQYTLSVKLHFEDGILTEITDIKATENADSSNDWYIQRAADGTSRISGVVKQIIDSQSTDNIDTVSGATCSSDAIVKAVKNAWDSIEK